MKSLIFYFISVISFTNATEASMKFERMDSNGWCSRGSKPKAPSPSYACYKFIETNDGDPSVIFDRRKIKSFERKNLLNLSIGLVIGLINIITNSYIYPKFV